MANEIIRLLDDDKMREQFAEDAIESAQRFTIENIGNMWVREIFENCLDRSIDREQFEKVKTLDQDPEVQATVDSYLEEIK